MMKYLPFLLFLLLKAGTLSKKINKLRHLVKIESDKTERNYF